MMHDTNGIAEQVKNSPAVKSALLRFAVALGGSNATDEQIDAIGALSAELNFTFVAVTLHVVDVRRKANSQN